MSYSHALRQTCQLCAELPETLGHSLIIRRHGRLYRALLHEIRAGDSRHLRGGRQIDERLSALLRAEGRELGDPDTQGNQTTVIMAKAGSHKAGVHSVGRDACASETSCQFVGEEEIREL